MLLNCGVREDSWESLGLQGDPTSPFWRRSVLGVRWKDWCWSWNSNTLATWCGELTHWKRPWCWQGLGAGGEGTTKDEMAGWHHWLDGHEFEWTPGVGDGQGGLACCNSWGCKESDTTEQLNWTELNVPWYIHTFFIHSSVDGHLGCFNVLIILNRAVYELGEACIFSTFSGYVSSVCRVCILVYLGSCANSIFVFLSFIFLVEPPYCFQ